MATKDAAEQLDIWMRIIRILEKVNLLFCLGFSVYTFKTKSCRCCMLYPYTCTYICKETSIYSESQEDSHMKGMAMLLVNVEFKKTLKETNIGLTQVLFDP